MKFSLWPSLSYRPSRLTVHQIVERFSLCAKNPIDAPQISYYAIILISTDTFNILLVQSIYSIRKEKIDQGKVITTKLK